MKVIIALLLCIILCSVSLAASRVADEPVFQAAGEPTKKESNLDKYNRVLSHISAAKTLSDSGNEEHEATINYLLDDTIAILKTIGEAGSRADNAAKKVAKAFGRI